MEKKTFVALVLSVVGGLLFSLGMCMCLVKEWEMFSYGVPIAGIGLVILLIILLLYRKMSGKASMKINAKLVGKILYGFLSTLVFGLGMCMALVFEGMMFYGIIVGIIGIVMLLCLIPMCIGFKDSKNK